MRVFASKLHPVLLRLEAAGLSVSELDAALAEHPKRGFICTVAESDSGATALLLARGFTLVRRTFDGGWRGDLAMQMPDYAHGTLAVHPDLTKPWLAAHRAHYRATHSANPPAKLDVKSWDEVFLGEDFRPEAAFYILVGGRIAAFSSLRPAAKGWELAWFGTIPPRHPDFAVLNAGLVTQETAFMAKQSILSALAEWDSTNPDAAWRVRNYALENQHCYLTFVLAF